MLDSPLGETMMSVRDALTQTLRPLWRRAAASRLVRNAPAPLQHWLGWLTHHPKSRAELHRYWQHPWDGRNDPEQYLRGEPKSQFLLGLIRRHASSDASVLEIGCNVGRNLHHLFEAGFTNLAGVDISDDAIGLLRRTYPAMAAVARLHVRPVEEFLPSLVDDAFDVVFTMAVLEHLHEDSASVFADIARVSKRLLVTVEDERDYAWRQFPRNYRKVFEGLGLHQVHEESCRTVPGLGAPFVARVFTR